ncbi:dUTP diphosphatase [Bacillus wiedmannii]|uniref:dUTP diphosphatase n=1 Tax=Bacillus wiedmannii TaxID=1890302 RepID=A0ABX5DK81_9BACI|nr:deoxyuridine 5'-triphosphate nucleotidohydrolase [Bacillus wiedmannii]PRT35333.1 deoxyuridine 5'-triphosphate nucleotidohydrolase [Bacillus wiedmannii]
MVKVKRLHEDAVIPQYAKPGDSGFDLVAVEDVIIEPGETSVIKTGLAFEIPNGYEMQIRPRSGLSRKTKLRVVLGTIDSGYRGEVGVIVDNIAPRRTPFNSLNYKHIDGTKTATKSYVRNCSRWREYIEQDKIAFDTYIIRKGDRIAQGVVSTVCNVDFEEVKDLTKSERGEGGYGSTGTQIEITTCLDGRKLGEALVDGFIVGIDLASGTDRAVYPKQLEFDFEKGGVK